MRVMMLPKGSIQGATEPYAPVGAPGISIESHTGAGAYALKLALKVLKGEKVDKKTLMPLDIVTPENIKLCKDGSFAELKDGCNVFDPSLVPAGWFSVIYNPSAPEVGFQAALTGQPESQQ
jgi:ribose transport system substrate-binding protein